MSVFGKVPPAETDCLPSFLLFSSLLPSFISYLFPFHLHLFLLPSLTPPSFLCHCALPSIIFLSFLHYLLISFPHPLPPSHLSSLSFPPFFLPPFHHHLFLPFFLSSFSVVLISFHSSPSFPPTPFLVFLLPCSSFLPSLLFFFLPCFLLYLLSFLPCLLQ